MDILISGDVMVRDDITFAIHGQVEGLWNGVYCKNLLDGKPIGPDTGNSWPRTTVSY